MPSRYVNFSEQARRVLGFAQEEALRFGVECIGTEHLLLGLMRDAENSAVAMLEDQEIETSKIREPLEFFIGNRSSQPVTPPGLSPGSKIVIELALDEFLQHGVEHVETGHLLIGILREGEGVAPGILQSLGLTIEKARAGMEQVPREDVGLSSLSGEMPPDESAELNPDWPDELTAVARALKVMGEAIKEASSQQNHERLTVLREQQAELGKRFQQLFLEWERQQTD